MVKIPNRFEDLYPASVVEKVLDVLQQPDLSGKVRETLDRVGLGDVNPLEQVQQAWQQAKSWVESVTGEGSGLLETEVINATGQLFHPDLEGVPISATVAQSWMRSAMRSHDVDRLEKRIERAVGQTLSGHKVAWAASSFGAMQSLLHDTTVLVAKTDLVRIQGVGNLESMLGGLEVIEVGPSNGCTEDDWNSAFDGCTSKEKVCVLSLSPNVLSVEEAERQLEGAKRFAQRVDVPHFGFLADGVLDQDLAKSLKMPLVKQQIDEYFQAAIVPLELMIGGPRGAIVVGDTDVIRRASHRLREFGAVLDHSGRIAAVLALQLASLDQEVDLGSTHYLLTNPDTLKERARRLAVQLHDNGVIQKAVEIQRQVALGQAPWNRYQVDNWAVELEPAESTEAVYSRLIRGEIDAGETLVPAILPLREGDKLVVDLRFIDPKHDHLLVLALSNPPVENEGSE